MGSTSRPLRLLVHPALAGLQVFQELREKGHVVDTALPAVETGIGASDPWSYDAILGPTSWRMTERHLQYLEESLKEARKRRYGTPGWPQKKEQS